VTTPEDDRSVYIRLSHAEALVLFEWLARTEAAKSMPIEDPAEEQVLWRIEGQLESELTEPLGPNYKEAVEAARKAIRESQQ
jgi:hypothetical protein